MHAPGVVRYELPRLSLSALVELGREISASRESARSMEEVAACVVSTLRDRFIDEHGRLSNVLVRFYRTTSFEHLDDGLRTIASRDLGGVAPSPNMRCLTLLASAGDRPEWMERTRSSRHQCIPLPSHERVAAMPMISQLMRQL